MAVCILETLFRMRYQEKVDTSGQMERPTMDNGRKIKCMATEYWFWKDGKKYEGYFVNDKREGQGKFTWKDGRIYDGMWKDGKQHGRGKFISKEGTERLGEWENGRKIKWL